MTLKIDENTTEEARRQSYIRGALVTRRIKNRDIAKAIGVTEGYICHVLAGRNNARWVRERISEILDIPYEKLWGSK